jgi:glycosyltransferase involved in cell wall biosynthesis
MHVVIASHHRLPVEGHGGTERIVVALVQGLAELGHRVTLIAAPGTKLPEASVIEAPAKQLRDPKLDLTPLIPNDAEILHAHFPVRHAVTARPFLQTLYGNLKTGEAVPPSTVFLSKNHATRHGATAFVYPGLPPRAFFLRRRKEQWDLFLGRLHSARGYQWAVEAAKRTGRRLIVAGGWRPSFTGVVQYVGVVDGNRKAALLCRARCLWMPALWDEPFDLTTTEALFSGTPVLATRRGALPEIVTGEVGALSDTLDEMIDAAETIAGRDPAACRAHAERYFTHRTMAEEYVRVYRHVTETVSLPAGRATPYAP